MSNKFMTQKHFEFIEDVLYAYRLEYGMDGTEYTSLCSHFAHELEKTNKLFKKNLFLKSCGVSTNESDNLFYQRSAPRS
jgi:hypothetical protein